MKVTLKLSPKMLWNIRQQVENRIENIHGFRGPLVDLAEWRREYGAELRRLNRMLSALTPRRGRK